MIYAGGNLILTGSFLILSMVVVFTTCIIYLKFYFLYSFVCFLLHFLKKQVYCVQTAITWSGNTQGLANTCV